jgi:glutathione reductase (NADPH)
MARDRYDVLIIGGGNAGLGVTEPTRKAGLSVAVAEPRELGGTCPNRGCTPKKVLVAAAHALHEIEQAGMHCITVGHPQLDWTRLIEREKKMIAPIPSKLERSMIERGVDLIREQAAFAGPNAVRVGARTIEAKHIVIATGSRPRPLLIPGAGLMITSDEVLSERERPGEVVFVGGGVIALEFGHVYARAGTKVTILEALPQLLGAMDADAVGRLRLESDRIGIRIHTAVKVIRIEKTAGRLRVVFEHDGREQSVDADRVVNGAGRIANVDALDLEAGKIEHRDFRIATDSYMRSTSNPSVFVCGDVLSTSPQLSPIATYEGRLVGRNIAEGAQHVPDYASIPSCVYTIPALASVGLTEDSARQKGLKFKVRCNDMLDWLSARTYAETVAWSKILVEEGSDCILGAHFVGHSGEELIHIFALAMAHGITATRIRDTVFAFPTFSADIKSML